MLSQFNSLNDFAWPEDVSHKSFNYFPYILCNEQNQAEILKALTSQVIQHRPKAHVGFSVWFNLDIISVTRPDYAIVCDIDPNVGLVYQVIKIAIANADNRVSFISKFLEQLGLLLDSPETDLEFVKCQIEPLLENPHGFLANEESYQVVKNLINKEKVFFAKVDILDPGNINQIKNFLAEKSLCIETLYASNISEWILEYQKVNFQTLKDNLNCLIESRTCLIDAFYPTQQKDGFGPPLRISVGQLPSFEIVKKECEKKPSSATTRRRLFSEAQESNNDSSATKNQITQRTLFFKKTPDENPSNGKNGSSSNTRIENESLPLKKRKLRTNSST